MRGGAVPPGAAVGSPGGRCGLSAAVDSPGFDPSQQLATLFLPCLINAAFAQLIKRAFGPSWGLLVPFAERGGAVGSGAKAEGPQKPHSVPFPGGRAQGWAQHRPQRCPPPQTVGPSRFSRIIRDSI